MDEKTLQPRGTEPGLMPEPPEDFSTTDAMVGVFTEPSETYESVSRTPGRNFWILPTIVFIVMNLIATFITFSDPEILGNMMDERMEAGRQKIEESVNKGDMTKEEGDKALEMQEKFSDPSSPFFIAIGYAFAVIGPFVVLFILSLIYLLALKILKSEVTYSAILNVVGLAFLISGIQGVLGSVMSILMGKITSISLGMILSADQIGHTLFSILNSFDIFSIWFYIVVSIGLTKVGKISSGQAYGLVFGLWIIWTILTAVTGGMFG